MPIKIPRFIQWLLEKRKDRAIIRQINEEEKQGFARMKEEKENK